MKKTDLIKIDTQALKAYAQEGGKLVLKKEAEDSLLKLLKTQTLINGLVEKVKNQIVDAGTSIDPDFSGVVAGKIKAICRKYGSPYACDPSKDSLPDDFVKSSVTNRVNTKKVKQYLKKHGELPKGIVVKDRKPVLSFYEKV